ncbi:MAG: hypothetical protein KDJ99_28775, partial [Candidatus Competibacteraceae bacterium]|nr:hypothetical protein [Candidatus Competibacteraceae bacterium]
MNTIAQMLSDDDIKNLAKLEDYTDNSTILTPNGTVKGLTGIRSAFAGLFAEFSKPGMLSYSWNPICALVLRHSFRRKALHCNLAIPYTVARFKVHATFRFLSKTTRLPVACTANSSVRPGSAKYLRRALSSGFRFIGFVQLIAIFIFVATR